MDEERQRLLGIKEDADCISGGVAEIGKRVSDIDASVGFPSPTGHAKVSQATEGLGSAVRNLQAHVDYLPLCW